MQVHDADIADSSSGDWGNPNLHWGLTGFDSVVLPMAQMWTSLATGNGGSGEFARTGTDTIFGIRTTKNFMNFLLQLGYEYTLSGGPSVDEEKAVGNRQKIFASLMWRVAPNIRLSVDGQTVQVAEGDEGVNNLEEKQSFASVSPRLGLLISPNVQLEMGAHFATKKARDQDSLLSARLWDEPGAFGNSLLQDWG